MSDKTTFANLFRTYPSMYIGIPGNATVYDQVGTLGKVHTHLTIAVPPGGLSSLSLSDSLLGDLASGQKTVPYDPGIPSSCESFEFQHQAPTSWATLFYEGSTHIEPVEGHKLSSNEMLLVPPIQLLTYDPAWRNCKWNTKGADRAGGWCM